jgi:hypothetical protein
VMYLCTFSGGVRNTAMFLLNSHSPFICLYKWNNLRTTVQIFLKFVTQQFYERFSRHSIFLYWKICNECVM